jgi:hypothetical protein
MIIQISTLALVALPDMPAGASLAMMYMRIASSTMIAPRRRRSTPAASVALWPIPFAAGFVYLALEVSTHRANTRATMPAVIPIAPLKFAR